PGLALIPTGPGETVMLSEEGLHYEECGRWHPDGKRVVFAARELQRGVRLYLKAIGGGKSVPITPEGTPAPNQQCMSVSPDGNLVAALSPERRLLLFPTTGDGP